MTLTTRERIVVFAVGVVAGGGIGFAIGRAAYNGVGYEVFRQGELGDADFDMATPDDGVPIEDLGLSDPSEPPPGDDHAATPANP